MTSDFSQPGGTTFSSTGTSPEEEKPSARAQFHDLKESVSEDVSAAREAIGQGRDAATEKIKDAVSEQAHFAARQVGGVASALQKVGAELESSDQPQVGRYARQIGDGVQDFASQMEGKDTGELARMAEDFGRKQPLAFLGVAALAGLMASRFLTASAKRHGGVAGTTATPARTTGSSFDGGGVSMANPAESAPLSELVTGLVTDVTGLVRKEIDLAKTEASEKFSKAMTGVETILVGVVFAIGAVGVLLSALVGGLAALFVNGGMTETGATALAAVIVGVVFAAIAWLLMSTGLKALNTRNLNMDRTVDSLRRDVDVVKEKM